MNQAVTKSFPLRIDCSTPGCTRCAAQIVGGVLRFRATHDGQRHEVILPLEILLRILAATKQDATEAKQMLESVAA